MAAILDNSGLPVQLVEFSDPIAQIAKSEFPELSVQTGDIVRVLEFDQSIDVAIVCRVSAYWQSADSFHSLIKSLSRFPRRRVLIDFYDRDVVAPGMRFEFSRPQGNGYWNFISFENVGEATPAIAIAKMDVGYSVGDLNLNYLASRSFFRKSDLLDFFKSHFPKAIVGCSESLIADDPSFAIVIDFQDGD